MRTLSPLRGLRAEDEPRLSEELRRNPDENAYLLGLLADYSLQGLRDLGWGTFYWEDAGDGLRSVFYADITGLAAATGVTERTAEAFAEKYVQDPFPIDRLISERESVRLLHESLERRDPRRCGYRRRFEETGMVFRNGSTLEPGEPNLRLAHRYEAKKIAEGSARAMAEELEVETSGEEYDRLVRSKQDLIRRRRYFVLVRRREILFQAYLSAALPDVCQIQGVWVPPERRGRGIAQRCIAEIARRSLERCDRVVLRVQNRNLPALAAYRKAGFVPFMDYLSIWY